MKKKERVNMYSGKTTFMNEEVPFEINGYAIKIFVKRDTVRDLLFVKGANGVLSPKPKAEPLPTNKLTCYTNDGRYYLCLFFKNDNYSAANFSTSVVVTIIIYFSHMIVTDLFSRNPTSNNYLGIVSNKFYRFLCMVPCYQMEEIGKPNFSLNLEFPSIKMVTQLKYKNYTIEVHPYASWSCSRSKLNYEPGLSFRFDRLANEDDIISFVNNWQTLTRFLFMRNNIFLESISISMGVFASSLYIWYPQEEKDYVEDVDSIYTDSISWDLIYEHIPNLFDLIVNNKIYILHLKDSVRERLSVNVYNAGLDAAAFEFEFDKFYPDGIKHKEKRIIAEKEIEEEINVLHSNSSGEKRKIYKKLKARIKSESLCDMMQMAFEDNSDYLISLKTKYANDIDYDTISKTCSDFRNDVDHGKDYGNLSDSLVKCFIMLRGLIYAMQLRRVGVDKEKISIAIYNLFNIKP